MKISLLLTCLLLGNSLFASHLRGGYIRIEHVAGLTYKVTITVFTNTVNTDVLFGGEDDYLDFGDGSDSDRDGKPGIFVPQTPSTITDDDFPELATASFSVLHTYPGNGFYIVSYSEPNRNETIINIDNSVATRFYLESGFLADPVAPSYQSPYLTTTPIFYTAGTSQFNCAINAYDKNDHTLLYTIATPKNTTNYRLPENFTINAYNGLITWDGTFNDSYRIGEYLFNVRISQRNENTLMGYMTVDFQVVVTESPYRPNVTHIETLDENNRIYVPLNSTKKWKVMLVDPGSSNTSLQMFSELEKKLSFSIYDSMANGSKAKVAALEFKNTGELTRDNPYLVTVRGGETENKKFFNDITFTLYTNDTDISKLVTDVIEEDHKPYSLYPNPFTDFLKLTAPDNSKVKVTIKSITGYVVLDEYLDDTLIINTEHLPASIFVYQIKTGNEIFTGKLLKK